MPSKPSDQRAYVRIAAELPHHPKIAALDDPIAGWAHVVALCYCGEHLTDGVFPAAAILRTASATKAKGDKLIRAGLWHGQGHDCPRCAQPPAGHAVIHDYLQHQHSQSYVRAVSQTRSAAGRQGSTQRWHPDSKSHSNSYGNSHGPPLAHDTASRWHTDSGVPGNPTAEVRSKNPGGTLGGQLCESNARASATKPPGNAATSANRPPERCTQHHGVDQDPGPCRGCMTARRRAEQWNRDQHLAHVMRIRTCPHCDAEGWRYQPGTRVPATPYERCNHRPLQSVS